MNKIGWDWDKEALSAGEYILCAMHQINTDIYQALSELYWPTFIERDGFIFLKEQFSEKRYAEVLASPEMRKNVELWINLFLVESYFDHESDDEKAIEGAELLTQKLIEIWTAKLKIDFPTREFIVVYYSPEDVSDCGLSFYQKR